MKLLGYEIKKIPRRPKGTDTTGLTLALEIDGHSLWVFDSLDVTPEIREMHTRLAHLQQDFCMTAGDQVATFEIVIQSINDGDLVSAGSVARAAKAMTNAYASEKVILEMAGWTILVDDEPRERPTEKHNKIKRELLKHEEVKAFFLNTHMRLLEELGVTLNSSHHKKSMMSRQRVSRELTFLSLIRSGLRQNLWDLPQGVSE